MLACLRSILHVERGSERTISKETGYSRQRCERKTLGKDTGFQAVDRGKQARGEKADERRETDAKPKEKKVKGGERTSTTREGERAKAEHKVETRERKEKARSRHQHDE